MPLIKVKILRENSYNLTQQPGQKVRCNAGDVVEIAEHLLKDMVASGAAVAVKGAVELTPKAEKPFDIETASKTDLVKKCEELKLSTRGSIADLKLRIGECLLTKAEAAANHLENKATGELTREQLVDIIVAEDLGIEEVTDISVEELAAAVDAAREAKAARA